MAQPSGGSEGISEYGVKAAFLYKFVHFVEWPPQAFGEASTPFTIGILGEDPFGRTLDDAVQGKTISGRPLVVRRFASPREVEACQLLFISRSVEPMLGRALESAGATGVLTVSDIDEFARRGGVIELLVVQNTVRFDVNLATAERAALRLSSKLLNVAHAVIDEPQP